MNHPDFETQEEWRNGILTFPAHWWQDVHWPQVTFAGLLGFALGLLVWGCA